MAGELEIPPFHCVTKYDQVRTITLSNDIQLQIRYSDNEDTKVYGIPNQRNVWTGSILWDAAESLAMLLSAEPHRIRGKRVIELGAGSGLVGLAAGALGASEVTLTDQVTFLAQHNLESSFSNQLEVRKRLKVQQLDWGDEEHIEATGPPYDVILGSDVLWLDEQLEMLAETLIQLSRPGTRILLSSPENLPHHKGSATSHRFYKQLQEHAIEVSDVLLKGPKAKRLKIPLDCAYRGAIGILELTMGESGKAFVREPY